MKEKIYEDGTYLVNNSDWHTKDSPWKATQIVKMLKIYNMHPKTICEIGCGFGNILKTLYEKFDKDCYFEGYDISPQAINHCQKISNEHMKFYNEDLLKLHNKYFDIVLCIDVIEHIENCFYFLRALKSKGRYKIFHVPLELSVQKLLRNKSFLKGRQLVGHIHYFTKDLIIAILKENGYIIKDFFYTASGIDTCAKNWKTSIMKMPRKFFFRLNKDLTVRLFGGYSILILTE